MTHTHRKRFRETDNETRTKISETAIINILVDLEKSLNINRRDMKSIFKMEPVSLENHAYHTQTAEKQFGNV